MDAMTYSKLKTKQEAGREASGPAFSYAKMVLSDLHEGEVWTLAERLDLVMARVVKQYIAEIRNDPDAIRED